MRRALRTLWLELADVASEPGKEVERVMGIEPT